MNYHFNIVITFSAGHQMKKLTHHHAEWSIWPSHDELKRLQIGVRAEGVALRVLVCTSSPAYLPGCLGASFVRPALLIQSGSVLFKIHIP